MERKTYRGLCDYGSIVVSFLVFMLAWFNGNLTDMPWYGLLLVIALATLSALAIFAVLDIRRHNRLAIAFGIMLLLVSVPSMMHKALGPMSAAETILFYGKQCYIPILGIGSLILLLKKQSLWRTILQWSMRVYGALGVMAGTVMLYANITLLINRNAWVTENMSGGFDMATTVSIITVVGIMLTIFGLIINPLYLVWRTTKQNQLDG